MLEALYAREVGPRRANVQGQQRTHKLAFHLQSNQTKGPIPNHCPYLTLTWQASTPSAPTRLGPGDRISEMPFLTQG